MLLAEHTKLFYRQREKPQIFELIDKRKIFLRPTTQQMSAASHFLGEMF
jgi:hypothetical protein